MRAERRRAGARLHPRLRWPLAAGVALLSLAACTGGDGTAGARAQIPTVGSALADPQVLIRAVDAGGMRSIDPSISTDVPAAHVLDDLFEGLTRLDERGAPVPGVASSWETSADGRTWTFHLRAAQWSNGAPLRAADFVYAWRRTVDPATASDYAQALAPVTNALAISTGQLPASALGIAAVDERTVRVTLNAPTPYLLSLLTKSYTYPQYQPAIACARRRLGAAGKHRQQRRLRAARVRDRRPRDAAAQPALLGRWRRCACSRSCTCRSIARCRPRASSPAS